MGEIGGGNIKALEIIYYIVSTLAFVLSLISFGWMIRTHKTKYSVCFSEFYIKNTITDVQKCNRSLVLIRYSFTNHSEQPLAITRVRMNISNNYFDACMLSYLAERHEIKQNAEKLFEASVESDPLPINLAGYEARSGFLAYLVPEGMLTGREAALNLQISSSRKVSAEKTLQLGEEYQVTTLHG